MNRKLISKAISDIDDVFIEEAIFYPGENFGRPPERTTTMENKRINSRRIIGLVLAACLIFTLTVTAYAADIGGIRRIIQIWFRGDLTTAVLDVSDGNYILMNEDGEVLKAGGGIALEPDGSERPLTEEEILEHFDKPDLVYNKDGTLWVYYHGQKIEITNLFDDEGICYLKIRDGKEVIYATIERNGGMGTSPIDYPKPGKFRTS